MAWSTSQLAELAGTTVKAVRHYHKLGLLDEPERLSNGYKQYQVAHLVRLLQITRLAELGVPLAQVAVMGRADQDPDESLRVIDAELAATIERLQRVRSELAVILHDHVPAELPAGFGPAVGHLNQTERSLLMIYSRIYDDAVMDEMRHLVTDEPRSELETEFDTLAPDADRATRRRLGELFAPLLQRVAEQYPKLRNLGEHAPRAAPFAEGTVGQAVKELYNPAQLEVMYRAHLISIGDSAGLAAFEAG